MCSSDPFIYQYPSNLSHPRLQAMAPPKTRTPAAEKLKFSDKLIKGHSTDVLLKKLKALQEELADMDQERVDTKSLSMVRKELIQTSLLLHKDKGVKAYVACCLADLLRLYAPDAPYTAHELRDIFQFFLRQLTTGLKNQDAPYYAETFYLLESLASIKSVVLVCDLPQADELMLEIFRGFFDLVGTDLPKNVELFITDVLVALIDEASTLPPELLDVLLAQFMRKQTKQPTAAYRLAVEVCSRTSERLQRNVCQYFTDIILQSDDEEEMERIETAHELVKALNRDCPALLLNVVPQLEEELKVDRLQMRTLATQVLGEMFGEVKNGVELSRKYHGAWQAWIHRKSDKAAGVRLAFVEATGPIIASHAELRPEVEDALQAKLLDPDEKVRAAACRVYAQMDYETVLHNVAVQQLEEVASRASDKKHLVRLEAFRCLGKLFGLAYPDIERNDATAVKKFAWIPSAIFQTAAKSADLKSEAEETVFQYILPVPAKGDDEAGWTQRLISVAASLDDRAMHNLLVMTNIKISRPSLYEKFIDFCEQNNGGVIDKHEEEVVRALRRVIQAIAGSFVDSSKASEDLRAFASMNEVRLYKAFRSCIDPKSDLKVLAKSQSEFLRRVEQTLPSCLITVTHVLRRASPWILNQSSVPTLVKCLQKVDSHSEQARRADRARMLLSYISKYCPVMHSAHATELSKALGETKNHSLVETALQALSAAVRTDPSLFPSDKRTVDRIAKFVMEDNPRLAKFAARALAHSGTRVDLCMTVFDRVVQSLPSATGGSLVSHLAAIAEFAQSIQRVFETRSQVITTHLVQLLMRETASEENDDNSPDWVDENQLDYITRAKLLSIKVFRNRCLFYVEPRADTTSAHEVLAPVLKMLWTILENGGATTPDSTDKAAVKAHLRLQASVALLKLSQNDLYCKIITANLPVLAVVVQDPSFHVRYAFLGKLVKYLQARKLDPRFNAVLFLTAHDPERDIRDKARIYVQVISHRSPEIKSSNFELVFVRLLHLLAHHPDFSNDAEGLKDMAKYIEFFTNLVASSDNISLLYHLASKLKTVQDTEDDPFTENLYVISELAQYIIKAYAQSQSWPLPTFPGKVKLPVDIFKRHESAEGATAAVKRTYIGQDTLAELNGVGKAWKSPNPKADLDKSSRKRKDAGAKSTSDVRSKRRRKTAESDTSGDESESDQDTGGAYRGVKSKRSNAEEGGETPLRRSNRRKTGST